MLQEMYKTQSGVKPKIVSDNLEDYIILPGREHGSISYQTMLVAKHKSLYEWNWHNARKALNKQDLKMLTIRQFMDLIKLLQSDEVCGGTGRQLSKDERSYILDSIIEKPDYDHEIFRILQALESRKVKR